VEPHYNEQKMLSKIFVFQSCACLNFHQANILKYFLEIILKIKWFNIQKKFKRNYFLINIESSKYIYENIIFINILESENLYSKNYSNDY